MTFSTAAWFWPQWTMFILMILGLLLQTALHGKPRLGDYSGFAGFTNFGLTFFILASGGFF